jgi:hypothetical protein
MKHLFFFALFLFWLNNCFAQNIFEQHGFDKAPLSLSKGQYNEFFNNDEVVQIGSVLLNTQTNKIVAFIEEDASQTKYLSDLNTRWLCNDPLAAKYPQVSPYAYVADNPLIFIDPNGKEIYFWMQIDKDHIQKVSFSQLNTKEQEAFLGLAMSKSGSEFLSNYVDGSQSFGNFTTLNGETKFDQDLNISFYELGFTIDGPKLGSTYTKPDGKSFDTNIDIDKNLNTCDMSYVLGHEALLHGLKDIKFLIENFSKLTDDQKKDLRSLLANGPEDHKEYSEGKGEGAQAFRQYLMEMLGWNDPKEMEKAKEEGDKNNDERVKKGK